MKARKKASRTSPNGRRKSAAAVRTRTVERVRRPEQRTIHFLTQDELRQLFKVIRSKRDKAIFLVAYRHGLKPGQQIVYLSAEISDCVGRCNSLLISTWLSDVGGPMLPLRSLVAYQGHVYWVQSIISALV